MADTFFCRECGKGISRTAKACPHCGARQSDGAGKNKIVAALLAFFLGGFGIHRFYLGQWWGIFYLLFCWTLIPGLVALVETVVFLVTSDDTWDEKYNNGMSSGNSTSLVVILVAIAVGFFVLVAIIGILAAVAIPAYQDYTIKAKMAAVEAESRKYTTAFETYLQDKKTIPASVQELGVTGSNKFIANVDIDQSTGTIDMALAFRPLEGKHFLMVPSVDGDKHVTWHCRSTDFKPAYLPTGCREK